MGQFRCTREAICVRCFNQGKGCRAHVKRTLTRLALHRVQPFRDFRCPTLVMRRVVSMTPWPGILGNWKFCARLECSLIWSDRWVGGTFSGKRDHKRIGGCPTYIRECEKECERVQGPSRPTKTMQYADPRNMPPFRNPYPGCVEQGPLSHAALRIYHCVKGPPATYESTHTCLKKKKKKTKPPIT